MFTILFAIVLSSYSGSSVPMTRSVAFGMGPSAIIDSLLRFATKSLSSVSDSRGLCMALCVCGRTKGLISDSIRGFGSCARVVGSIRDVNTNRCATIMSARVVSSTGFGC